jgi:uncharacterized phage-associated protein
MKLNRSKLKALVLYVIWRAGRRGGFGATKLNKVLWFADARHYVMYGKPITGETYIRKKFGPVPEHINEICKELEKSGLISKHAETYHGKDLKRFIANSPPPVDMFSADELSVIDWWIKSIDEEHSAASISEKSHDYAWKIASEGEALPLYAMFASRIRAPLGEELEWARKEAKRLGLA